MPIWYPSEERLIELNYLALTLFKVKKADQPKVLSHSKLREAIDECKEHAGDIHDKAVALLSGIIKKHAFAAATDGRRSSLPRNSVDGTRQHSALKAHPCKLA